MAISDPEQLLTIVNEALQAETRIDIDELSLQLRLDDGVLSHNDRRGRGTSKNNSSRCVVRMVLEKDPLVHATQLRVGTAAGVVEMRGLVASEEERDLALSDAWYVPDVWDVVDHIEVRP